MFETTIQFFVSLNKTFTIPHEILFLFLLSETLPLFDFLLLIVYFFVGISLLLPRDLALDCILNSFVQFSKVFLDFELFLDFLVDV